MADASVQEAIDPLEHREKEQQLLERVWQRASTEADDQDVARIGLQI